MNLVNDFLLTGTPGVGKSKLCAEIAKKYKLKWQDVSKIATKNGFVEDYDEKLECPVLHEDDVSFFSSEKPLLFRLLTLEYIASY